LASTFSAAGIITDDGVMDEATFQENVRDTPLTERLGLC
jgi:hypothetical protein